MNSQAEAYTELAKGIIKSVLTNRDGAVLWWKDEAAHRKKYGLTEQQQNELILLLREKFAQPQETTHAR